MADGVAIKYIADRYLANGYLANGYFFGEDKSKEKEGGKKNNKEQSKKNNKGLLDILLKGGNNRWNKMFMKKIHNYSGMIGGNKSMFTILVIIVNAIVAVVAVVIIVSYIYNNFRSVYTIDPSEKYLDELEKIEDEKINKLIEGAQRQMKTAYESTRRI